MSLLTLIQDAGVGLGLIAKPSDLTVVIANTDPTIQQLLAIANKEGRDLNNRYDWEALIFGLVFTTVPNINKQGTFDEDAVNASTKLIVTSGIPFWEFRL